MGNTMNKKSLPEELIIEILLKLPLKSLIICRCVSKYLHNLIKSPNFVNTHFIKHKDRNFIILIRQSPDSTATLSFHDYESLDVISPDLEIPLVHTGYLGVCGPCNGLICLSDRINTILLCNPSTREFREISPVPFTWPEGYDSNITSIGFGFDSNTNSYKVICFIFMNPNKNHPEWGGGYVLRNLKYVCLIYNLSSNTWREIDYMQGIDARNSYIEPTLTGVLHKGIYHWIVSDDYDLFIFHFDMSTEVFGCMKLPDIVSEDQRICESLLVLNDSLAFFAYGFPEYTFVDIWVMEQYGVAESWTKQFSIGPVTRNDNPLLVWKNEAILCEVIEEEQDAARPSLVSLFSCDLNTEEMVDHEIQGYRNTFRPFVCQESLVSIN